MALSVSALFASAAAANSLPAMPTANVAQRRQVETYHRYTIAQLRALSHTIDHTNERISKRIPSQINKKYASEHMQSLKPNPRKAKRETKRDGRRERGGASSSSTSTSSSSSSRRQQSKAERQLNTFSEDVEPAWADDVVTEEIGDFFDFSTAVLDRDADRRAGIEMVPEGAELDAELDPMELLRRRKAQGNDEEYNDMDANNEDTFGEGAADGDVDDMNQDTFGGWVESPALTAQPSSGFASGLFTLQDQFVDQGNANLSPDSRQKQQARRHAWGDDTDDNVSASSSSSAAPTTTNATQASSPPPSSSSSSSVNSSAPVQRTAQQQPRSQYNTQQQYHHSSSSSQSAAAPPPPPQQQQPQAPQKVDVMAMFQQASSAPQTTALPPMPSPSQMGWSTAPRSPPVSSTSQGSGNRVNKLMSRVKQRRSNPPTPQQTAPPQTGGQPTPPHMTPSSVYAQPAPVYTQQQPYLYGAMPVPVMPSMPAFQDNAMQYGGQPPPMMYSMPPQMMQHQHMPPMQQHQHMPPPQMRNALPILPSNAPMTAQDRARMFQQQQQQGHQHQQYK